MTTIHPTEALKKYREYAATETDAGRDFQTYSEWKTASGIETHENTDDPTIAENYARLGEGRPLVEPTTAG